MAKNKTISLKKLLQTIVLLIFATTWFNSASASFLCVCSDGHTSIENIYSSECHKAEFEDYDNTSAQIYAQHDCEDTVLFNDGINSNFNRLKNTQVQQTHTINNFVKTNIASLTQDQSYLSAPFIQTDHRLRLFTDSVRLII